MASFVQLVRFISVTGINLKKNSYVLLHNINMPLFIPSVGGHLGCFDFLAFVNKAAVNMIVHVFVTHSHSFLLVIYL